MGGILSLFQGKHSARRSHRPTTEDGLHPDEERTAQQQLIHDVARIRTETATLDRLFKDISSELLSISTSPSFLVRRSFRNSVRELHDECIRVESAYHNSVWNTREIAGEVQAVATDFVQVCIPRLRDTEPPVSGAQITELKDYESSIQARATKIKDIRDAFDKLSEHVDMLSQRWLSLTAQHKFGMFKSKTKPLTLKFSQACSLASSVQSPNDGEGTLFVLRTLGPAFIEKKQADTTMSSLSSDPDRSLDISQQSSYGLFSRIVAICYLLSAVAADIHDLRVFVDPERELEGDTLSQQTLNDRLTDMEETYSCVIDALQDYQTSIASP